MLKIFPKGNGVVRNYRHNKTMKQIGIATTTACTAALITDVVIAKSPSPLWTGFLSFVGLVNLVGTTENSLKVENLKRRYEQIVKRAKSIYKK